MRPSLRALLALVALRLSRARDGGRPARSSRVRATRPAASTRDARLVVPRRCGRRRSRSRCSTSRPRRAGSRSSGASAASRPSGLALAGQGRPQLHLPRPRQGPVEHPARGAAGHVRRGARAGPDGGPAPGGGARRRRARAGGGGADRADPPGGAARRPRARRAPQGLRRPPRHVLGVPDRGGRAPPRLRGRGRDRRPHDALREARARAPTSGSAAREFLRARLFDLLDLRLRPAPQAVALGEDGPGTRSGTRSPRTATRPSRATRACSCARPPATSRSSGPSGRSTTGSSASPTTAASRTAGCCRSCRARRGARWREDLKAALTDEVIERAARRMPPEWYAIDGARLAAALKQRRDALVRGGRPLLPAPRRPGGRAGHERRRGGPRAAARGRRGRGGAWRGATRDGDSETPYFSRRFVPGETARGAPLPARRRRPRGGRGAGAAGSSVRAIGGAATTCSTTRGRGDALLRLRGPEPRGRGPGTRPGTDAPTGAARAEERRRGSRRATGGATGSSCRGRATAPTTASSSGGGFATASYGFRQQPFASQHDPARGLGLRRAASREIDYEGEFHRGELPGRARGHRQLLGPRGPALLRLRQRDDGRRRTTTSTRCASGRSCSPRA